jgi:hypothetical protein
MRLLDPHWEWFRMTELWLTRLCFRKSSLGNRFLLRMGTYDVSPTVSTGPRFVLTSPDILLTSLNDKPAVLAVLLLRFKVHALNEMLPTRI